MAVCPKCNTEHDGERNYCRHCGSFLLTDKVHTLTVEGLESKGRDQGREKLICPKCQVSYEIGNYCRKCGSLLAERSEFQETDGQPFEKKLIKRQSEEWLRLFEEKKTLETCLSQLEAQKDKVSGDLFHLMSTRYQDQLESSSSLHREIETELESVRKRASDEIERLEKELTLLQQRRGEIESLYLSGSMTQADFLREKKDLKKEIEPGERSLKKYRQIISLLPSKMGGNKVSYGMLGNLLRPFPLVAASGIVILVVAGGYFLWHRDSQSSTPISQEIVISPPATSSRQSQSTVTEGQEVKKIRALLENIRQANLQKDIDLFMSCYSRDFNDKQEKQLATLKFWEHFDYLDLSYDLKKKAVTGDRANVRVEWRIRTAVKASGQPQDSRAVLDVTLGREEGHWKIKEIKSVG